MNPLTKLTIILGLVAFLSISAAAYGSIKSVNAWEFCAAGDLTDKAVMAKMKEHPCAVNVLLGDYYGKESTFVAGFKEPGVPVLAACGNHDDCSKVIKNDNIKTGDKTFYGFKWNNVGFIILNSELSIKSQKSELYRLGNLYQENENIDHIVIALHKCVICNQSAHHKETELKSYRSELTTFKDTFSKFSLLLQGHNHGYQECDPETPHIKVVTDGTGGRTPYPWGSATDDNCHNYLSGSKYNGFTILTVGGPTEDIEPHHINVK